MIFKFLNIGLFFSYTYSLIFLSSIFFEDEKDNNFEILEIFDNFINEKIQYSFFIIFFCHFIFFSSKIFKKILDFFFTIFLKILYLFLIFGILLLIWIFLNYKNQIIFFYEQIKTLLNN